MPRYCQHVSVNVFFEVDNTKDEITFDNMLAVKHAIAWDPYPDLPLKGEMVDFWVELGDCQWVDEVPQTQHGHVSTEVA